MRNRLSYQEQLEREAERRNTDERFHRQDEEAGWTNGWTREELEAFAECQRMLSEAEA